MISAWSVFAAFLGSIVGALIVFALLVLCYAAVRVLLERYLAPRRNFPFRRGLGTAQYSVGAHSRA
jgi:hypothetical protein